MFSIWYFSTSEWLLQLICNRALFNWLKQASTYINLLFIKFQKYNRNKSKYFSSSHDPGWFSIHKNKFIFVGLINTDMSLELLALGIMILFYLGLLKVK